MTLALSTLLLKDVVFVIPGYMTIPDMMKRWGMCHGFYWRKISNGTLPATRLANSWAVKVDDAESFMAQYLASKQRRVS